MGRRVETPRSQREYFQDTLAKDGQARKPVVRLRRDPSPLVRARALHVEERDRARRAGRRHGDAATSR